MRKYLLNGREKRTGVTKKCRCRRDILACRCVARFLDSLFLRFCHADTTRVTCNAISHIIQVVLYWHHGVD